MTRRELLGQLLTRRRARDERVILDLLAQADTEELNEMLADVRLTDRLLGGPRSRWDGDRPSEVVALLSRTRRAELGLPARAALIHALQTGRTTLRDELLVRDLFTEVSGTDLTTLKNLIDATPDHNDLEELVFRDVDSQRVRNDILAHIAVQARRVPRREAKVLSDIDDTTICTLYDKRFPKGVVYPGVLALWQALDEGPDARPGTLGDLTFITARPADILGWIEDRTRNKLRGVGVSSTSMLTGSLIHLRSSSSIANKKIDNINHYHQLFPEYRLVFIGDSGQGDVMVGQRLLTEFSGSVDAVLIHDVIDTDPDTRAQYALDGIIFFDTYVGAATAAHRAGLISYLGLRAVADATCKGFDEVPWRNPGQEARARDLLRRDLIAMAAAPGQSD